MELLGQISFFEANAWLLNRGKAVEMLVQSFRV